MHQQQRGCDGSTSGKGCCLYLARPSAQPLACRPPPPSPPPLCSVVRKLIDSYLAVEENFRMGAGKSTEQEVIAGLRKVGAWLTLTWLTD